jgi:hypothetical protein
MNRASRTLLSAVAVTLLAGGSSAIAQDRKGSSNDPTPLAVGDPAKVLYYVPGVLDNGGVGAGFVTVFHCSSLSPVTERMSFVVRNYSGALLVNKTLDVTSLRTVTVVTHQPSNLSFDLNLNTGPVIQGFAVIRSTSTNTWCSAMSVDATSPVQGVALHMVRSNAAPGTQE